MADWDRATSVAQLHQHLRGWELVERHAGGYRVTDALRRLVDERGGVGAIYGLFRTDPWSGRDDNTGVVPEARADVAHLLQGEVRAASGGIGALLVAEATHGELALGAVPLPTNLAQAATWDPDLVRAAADAVGRAVRASGTHLALCSGADILRDPRWGRCEETFGEDPTLAAQLVTAQVTGMQGGPQHRPDTHPGVVVKHVAGQGGAVGGLNAMSAPLGRSELTDVHLPPVEAAVRAGAVGLMAAYNDLDGVPCVLNRWLLTDLVRERWGFTGVVMSDALAIDRAAESLGPEVAAHRALLAGCDLNLGDLAWAQLAISGDDSVEAALRRAAARVWSLKQRFGLLRDQSEPAVQRLDPDEVADASRALARSCLTILGATPPPVPESASILVTGPFADSVESLLGDYSPPVKRGRFRSLAGALRHRFRDVTSLDWRAPSLQAEAAAAQVVVVQLGGTSERHYGGDFAPTGAVLGSATDLASTCGEGLDLADLALPHGQDAWLADLRRATSARIIAVAVMGRPHLLRAAAALVDDLVIAWYPGPFGGDAIADLVAGDVAPRGRLPVALLAAQGALGWHDNDRVGTVEAHWVDVPEPAFARPGDGGPGDVRLTSWDLARDEPSGTVTIRLSLSASGSATEVVRVYTRRLGGARWPRRRVLLDFRRVDLRPDERRELTLVLAEETVFGASALPAALPVPEHPTHCVVTIEPFGVSTTITAPHRGDT